MKLKLHRFQLETKTPFKIARTSYNVRDLLVVELQEGKFRGYGEASAHSFYKVDVKELEEVLENLRSKIESHDLKSPEAFFNKDSLHYRNRYTSKDGRKSSRNSLVCLQNQIGSR